MAIKSLDCGHEPSPHGEHTTGTAHTSDGREVCWDCALREELESLKTRQQYTAYLSRDERNVPVLTNWPGSVLARVTNAWEVSAGGFCRGQKIWRFRATDVHGNRWYGTSPGFGMYARMHRAKSSTVR